MTGKLRATGGGPAGLIAALAVVALLCAWASAWGQKDEARGKLLFDGKSLDGWKSTAFGAEGEVMVKDGTVVLEQGNDMTGITYTRGDFPKIDYEVSLEAKRIEGNDF